MMGQPVAQNIGKLLVRAKDHDEAALAELINLHTERLLQSVRAELGSRMRQRLESQDVVQQVFLDALRCIDQFAGQNSDAFLGWLRSIALHRIRDADRRHFQAQKRAKELRVSDVKRHASWPDLLDALSASTSSPSNAAARGDRLALLRNALIQLNERQREAIELRYLMQMSVTEAADKMSCSERAVRSLCVRGLIRLRGLLGDAI